MWFRHHLLPLCRNHGIILSAIAIVLGRGGAPEALPKGGRTTRSLRFQDLHITDGLIELHFSEKFHAHHGVRVEQFVALVIVEPLKEISLLVTLLLLLILLNRNYGTATKKYCIGHVVSRGGHCGTSCENQRQRWDVQAVRNAMQNRSRYLQ